MSVAATAARLPKRGMAFSRSALRPPGTSGGCQQGWRPLLFVPRDPDLPIPLGKLRGDLLHLVGRNGLGGGRGRGLTSRDGGTSGRCLSQTAPLPWSSSGACSVSGGSRLRAPLVAHDELAGLLRRIVATRGEAFSQKITRSVRFALPASL